MSCGIYYIKNKTNGKMYIGKSIDIQKRWKSHKTQLKNGNHVNPHLQSSWDKYGDNAFEFSIIEECACEELNDREKYWIQFYDSFNNGYNLTFGGEGGNTIAGYTEEELKRYKEKKHKIHQETVLKGEDASTSKLSNSDVKEIIQRMLNGEFNVDIANDYNVNFATIRDIRSHNTWKDLTSGIEFPHPHKNYVKNSRGKAVSQYTKDGQYVATYISAREAERITGCPFKNISAVCHGKKHTCLGYIWKFAEENFELKELYI